MNARHANEFGGPRAAQATGEPATLLELMKMLGRRPLLLVGSAVVGGLIGLLAAAQMPANYEASGLVQIGRVMQPTDEVEMRDHRDASARLALKEVEPAEQAAARVKTPGFVAASKLTGGSPEQLAKAVNVQVVKDTRLLDVRYRAASRDAARRGVQALAATLAQRHEQLAQEARGALAAQLKVVEQLRAASADQRTALLQSLRGVGASAGAAALPFLQLAVAGQGNELLSWEVNLRAALVPGVQTPTALVEPVSVTDSVVTPGRVLICVGGLLAGILFAAIVMLAQYMRQRPRLR